MGEGLKTWLKAELHTHTCDDPEDGRRMVRHSARSLIRRASDLDFEVLAITNHNQQFFTRDLENFATDHGILLIPAVEATISGKHLLLYNFQNYCSDWRRPEQVDAAKGADQLVIAPHAFYPLNTALKQRSFEWADRIDAFEINGFFHRFIDFNRRTRKAASELNKPLVACSDLHFLYQLGRSYSMIYAEKDRRSVIQAIKQGQVKLRLKPASILFLARWLIQNGLARTVFGIKQMLAYPGKNRRESL